MIKAAAKRRDRWAALAAIALDRHALITEAMGALSWEAVARKSAEPLAVVDQYLYRTVREVTEVLEAAGLPHSHVEDWQTPEARDFGEQTRNRHRHSIFDALNVPKVRRHVASMLLVEAWESIAGEIYGAKEEGNAADMITAALQERLVTGGELPLSGGGNRSSAGQCGCAGLPEDTLGPGNRRHARSELGQRAARHGGGQVGG